MKSKIVLWGTNAQDEKTLIAVALRAEENKVDIWTFPESVATEDFYQQMMKQWRDGEGLELPEPHTHLERELSVTGNLLPDDLKAERTDVVQRAQTEWHFTVLSSKLHQSYATQLEELKERVEKLEEFDQGMWGNLKEFWAKLQEQVRERNLFREHADTLRDNTNALFAKMKDLRAKMDAEFEQVSQEAHDRLMAALEEIEKKVSEGSRLHGLFEELKKLQRDFREAQLTRAHRGKIWDKLNAAFKTVKQKRFGQKADDGNSQAQRLQRRYDGLMAAIEKMENSIKRDKNDLGFQQHKIDTTDGQLEAQIRQAKIVMIEERIRSKEEKLGEMKTTQTSLENRLKQMKEREERQAAKEAAKEKAKEKIAEEIKAAAAAREKEDEDAATAQPATADNTEKVAQKEDSATEAIASTLGESLEDVVDTIKAVASVIGDKIEEAIEELKEDVTGTKDEPETAAAETDSNDGEEAEVLVEETVEAEAASGEAAKD